MMRKLALVSMMSFLLVGGCGDMPSYLSALSKLATNTGDPPVGDLTADEIVALTNHASELGGLLGLSAEQVAAIPTLTTAQAQIIVNFLDENNITNVSQLQALDPNSVNIPDDLKELMNAMGFQL